MPSYQVEVIVHLHIIINSRHKEYHLSLTLGWINRGCWCCWWVAWMSIYYNRQQISTTALQRTFIFSISISSIVLINTHLSWRLTTVSVGKRQDQLITSISIKKNWTVLQSGIYSLSQGKQDPKILENNLTQTPKHQLAIICGREDHYSFAY